MNHLGPATVIFLGMHLRLRTAISPLSGPEFSYHHITQAEKTPSHEQIYTTYYLQVHNSGNYSHGSSHGQFARTGSGSLRRPDCKPLPASARRKTSHARPLLLIWYLSCWIGFPRSTNRGVTFYCSFNYFRGWCCPMPSLVLVLFIVYLDTNSSSSLFRSARLSSDTSTKTFTSLFGLDWLELSWLLLLSSPLGLFTIRTPRNGSSPQPGGQPTQESW